MQTGNIFEEDSASTIDWINKCKLCSPHLSKRVHAQRTFESAQLAEKRHHDYK